MNLVFLERDSLGDDVDMTGFAKYGTVTEYPYLDLDKIQERAKDADILFINKSPVNAETMKDASHLTLVCEMATGFDNVDIAWCRENGITVCNVPAYSTASVAQHTFALALALLGKIPYYDTVVKSGRYSEGTRFSIFDQRITELDGKTWGIAGMGNIGRAVEKIASAFGCRVITYSTSHHGEDPAAWDAFLSEADIVSLHCPLTDKTEHLMDAYAFSKMKKSAILINVARGKVVDQNALSEALNNGEIAGAGLDVFETEPTEKENPLLSIQDSNKLLLSPHMAWASVEARQRDCDITLQNMISFLEGNVQNSVN